MRHTCPDGIPRAVHGDGRREGTGAQPRDGVTEGVRGIRTGDPRPHGRRTDREPQGMGRPGGVPGGAAEVRLGDRGRDRPPGDRLPPREGLRRVLVPYGRGRPEDGVLGVRGPWGGARHPQDVLLQDGQGAHHGGRVRPFPIYHRNRGGLERQAPCGDILSEAQGRTEEVRPPADKEDGVSHRGKVPQGMAAEVRGQGRDGGVRGRDAGGGPRDVPRKMPESSRSPDHRIK